MNKNLYHSHDHFFKKSLSDLRVAKDFFMQHLPFDIQKQVDFNQLKFQRTSFIDDKFKNSEADVVYSTQFNSEIGYFYILLEHQQKIDEMMPYRLLKYQIALMDNHLKQTREKKLPIVYPMVFYTGEIEYHAPLDIFPLFGKHASLAQKIWMQPFHLIDAKHIEDTDLKAHFWAGVMEFVFKHRALGNMMNVIEDWLSWLHNIEVENGYDYASFMIKYMLDKIEPANVESFLNMAKHHLSKKLGDETMTYGDLMRQQGMEQGIKEGIKEGILQEKHQIAKNLLRLKTLSIKQISEITDISETELYEFARSIETN